MLEKLRIAFELLPPRIARRYLLLLPVAGVGALLEAAGAALMLGLIRLIAEASATLAEAVPVIGERLSGAGFGVQGLALICAAFFVFKNALRLSENWLRFRVNAGAYEALSAGLLERFLLAPYPAHLKRHSSELIHIARTQVSDVVWTTLNSMASIVSEALIALSVVAILAFAAPLGALLVASFLGGLLGLLLYLTQRAHSDIGRRFHHASMRQLKAMQQSLGGVKEVKVFGREAFFVDRIRETLRDIGRVNTARLTLEQVPRLSVETLFVAGLALLVAFARGGQDQSLATTLGVTAYGALRVLPATHMAVYHANRIQQSAAALYALRADWVPLPEAPRTPSTPLRFEQELRLENVSFRYDETSRPAIRNLNLAIPRGASVGVVGPTGAGKSTLIDLLTGLLPPTEGRITVDERDLRTCTRGWQAQLGYVPQDPHLLDDTIRRNIALGVEDRDIDEQALERAVRSAQLAPLLRGLPEGLETVVGERGVRLSGGERQRVAIARALYRAPSTLIFDEATSALDNLTEQALSATLEGLRGEKTIILIAHRLSTVRSCDLLFFLVDGQLEACGSYAELLVSNGAFRRMAEAAARHTPSI